MFVLRLAVGWGSGGYLAFNLINASLAITTVFIATYLHTSANYFDSVYSNGNHPHTHHTQLPPEVPPPPAEGCPPSPGAQRGRADHLPCRCPAQRLLWRQRHFSRPGEGDARIRPPTPHPRSRQKARLPRHFSLVQSCDCSVVYTSRFYHDCDYRCRAC